MTLQPLFHLLILENIPIFEQLQIEEALLRADNRNWCIINRGSTPAIVMGISGKQKEHLNAPLFHSTPIPIIRRFSGGGTVVVDDQTYFLTLMGNRSILNVPCYPEELLRWTENLYAPAFSGIPFALRENDYIIENKKFGGNAQYLSKDRWLHHTSLLWDFRPKMMSYLLIPPKIPAYRDQRSHEDFLCRLKDHFSTVDSFQDKILKALSNSFTLVPTFLSSINEALSREHRKFTRVEDILV